MEFIFNYSFNIFKISYKKASFQNVLCYWRYILKIVSTLKLK